MMNDFGLISLFCGPGGFDQGFKEVGFTTRLAYDKDAACVETHRHNHPEANAREKTLDWESAADIIADWDATSSTPPVGVIGGPPCQSFSQSNVFQTDTDHRHTLPAVYAHILKALNERYNLSFFVFENVPGLITKKHSEKFAGFKVMFENAGFNIFEGSLDAQHFGVAQERRRVFIVGINQQKHPGVKFEFPGQAHAAPLTVKDAIGHLAEIPPVPFTRGLKGGTFHPNHWCMAPKSAKFTEGVMNPGEIMGRCFRVLAWERPSYTVAYGHREVHVHPTGKRRLSVYEAMLLQGFPPDYVLKGTLSDQIRLVSEAVAPPVAKVLADALNMQLGLQVAVPSRQSLFETVMAGI